MRRNNLETAMEVLAALREGPQNPSRLAQRCNINYGRLGETIDSLLTKGWIGKESTGSKEVYTLTDKGLEFLLLYLKVSNEYWR
jgi:predicted transcriptional regulator